MRATNCHYHLVVANDGDHRLLEQDAHRVYREDPFQPKGQEGAPHPGRRHLSLFLLPGYAHALPSVSDGGPRRPYPKAARAAP